MRLSVLLSILPLALAAPAPATRSAPAPLVTRGVDGIADKYIVKFRDGSPLKMLQDAMTHLTGEADHVFNGAFKGFAGTMNEATIKLLRHHPDVEYIEQDMMASTDGYVTDSGAPWGLGRISHRQKGSNQYTYDDSAGQGTCAYVIDSGVDDTHPEFEGRAHQVKSFIDGQTTDNFGHGTHCSGTIGSRSYGVAKKIEIYGVKVLGSDGRGPYSGIIAGMNYVADDSPRRNCPNGVVVSMSLGGGYSQAVNDAAAGLVNRGYFVAVAAGNDNQDASNTSPASEQSVCTVGGSAIDDTRYNNSNFGPVVDIVGPAVGVLSTLPNNRSAYYTGTSMATPHVAGLAAYLAAKDGVKPSGASCEKIRQMATRNAITNQSSNTVNLLAFNGNPSG